MAFKTNREVLPGVIATYGRVSKTGDFKGNLNNNDVIFGFEWFMSRDWSLSNPDKPVDSVNFDIPYAQLMGLIVQNPTDVTGCIYAILNSLDPSIEGNAVYEGSSFFGLQAILEDGQTELKI